MSKWMLAASAAALAIAAPTAAERGNRGGGQGGQPPHAQSHDRGGGQSARGQRSGGANREFHAQRIGGSSREIRAPRGGGDRARGRTYGLLQSDQRGRGQARPEARRQEMRRQSVGGQLGGQDRRRAERVEQPRGKARDAVRFGARDDRHGRDRDLARDIRVNRARDLNRGRDVRLADFNGDRIVRLRDYDRGGTVRFRNVDRDEWYGRRLGYGVGGCPPGLASKGCMPPGQAAKFIGQPLLAASRYGTLEALPLSMRSLYWDNDDYYYRYGGGYLYRVNRDRDLISSIIPLFGASLLGRQLSPSYVNSYYQPSYYNSFYRNSPYDCYQYGYGYVYETDCATGLVEDVIPTYDYGYGVGQMLPASYGYYNLPYTYRSSFIDNDDYYYRYAPGAIYRVDRDTSLISAVAALLTNGLSVGQPLPMGYSAYNVPMAYRASYYDTPDAWYRYDNGYIYAVDPGTRMVRSVAYAIV